MEEKKTGFAVVNGAIYRCKMTLHNKNGGRQKITLSTTTRKACKWIKMVTAYTSYISMYIISWSLGAKYACACQQFRLANQESTCLARPCDGGQCEVRCRQIKIKNPNIPVFWLCAFENRIKKSTRMVNNRNTMINERKTFSTNDSKRLGAERLNDFNWNGNRKWERICREPRIDRNECPKRRVYRWCGTAMR